MECNGMTEASEPKQVLVVNPPVGNKIVYTSGCNPLLEPSNVVCPPQNASGHMLTNHSETPLLNISSEATASKHSLLDKRLTSVRTDARVTPYESFSADVPTEEFVFQGKEAVDHLQVFKSPSSKELLDRSADFILGECSSGSSTPHLVAQCNGTESNVGDVHFHSGSNLDLNGRSGSHTPVSTTDTKMDLVKMDDTIDYVLTLARSDEPHEGIFVLPNRLRQPVHSPSPNPRTNTPSSSLIASPAASPSSSPRSGKLSCSPMINSTVRSQSIQTCVNPVPHYIVDQTSGLLQFSSGISQPTTANCHNQQAVSLLLYSDTGGSNRVHMPEHLVSQVGTPFASSTHMVFHPNMVHGLSNHGLSNHAMPQSHLNAQQSVTPISLHRNYPSLLTPTKTTLTHSLSCFPQPNAVVSPTHRFHSSDLETASNRTIVSTSPNTLCFVQNPQQSFMHGTLVTPLSMENINGPFTNPRSPHLSAESKPVTQTHMPVSFRQPMVSSQPVTAPSTARSACDQTITPNTSPVRGQNLNATVTKRRPTQSGGGSAKRRKGSATLSAPSPTLPFTGKPITSELQSFRTTQSFPQEYVDKLKLCDIKSLVSAPVLRPFFPVLSPQGSSDQPHIMNPQDEEQLLSKRGMKYTRGPLMLSIPKFFPTTANLPDDGYLLQHLDSEFPQSSLIRGVSQNPSFKSNITTVCPSPEPLSFENNMMTLFSSMRKSSRDGCLDKTKSYPDVMSTSSSIDTLTPGTLLPVFSDVPITGRHDPDRRTPPLPLYHMPNPRLLCQPIFLNSVDADKRPCTKLSNNSESSVNTDFANVKVDPPQSAKGLVDSETGELLSGRSAPSYYDGDTRSGGDKIHITFTINPSMMVTIPMAIRHIAGLLGIDGDSIRYEVTRSGAEITLDQNQCQSAMQIRNLESELREHFTPLSLHFEVQTTQPDLSAPRTGNCTDNVSSSATSHSRCGSPASLTPCSRIMSETSALEVYSSSFEPPKYTEEAIAPSTLLLNKRDSAKPCQNCDKILLPNLALRKSTEEISELTGLSVRSDFDDDLTFCSSKCVTDFVRLVSVHKFHTDYIPPTQQSGTGDSRHQVLMCGLPLSAPVLLQNPKHIKQLKRQQCSGKRRGACSSTKKRRWHGSRWCSFSSDSVPWAVAASTKPVTETDLLQELRDNPVHICLPVSLDHRICVLCRSEGDAPEESLGRLLPLDVDRWIHINCAVWCYEVYETVSGSLSNVNLYVEKALATVCSHCGELGAGLPCYNPRCTFIYHVPCALSINCMFFTDRGMYCPQHQPKDPHPLQIFTLSIARRVYITRDENSQVGDVIHQEDRVNAVRIGSVSLFNVGQLLPHQIESGHFHSRRHIYPVGFHTSRIYWSMRRQNARACYTCKIEESHGRPLFRVTVRESGFETESFTDETCNGVWQRIFNRVADLREDGKRIRFFSQHLKGEDLYGLSEPHIIRAIESLPGVDCLRDYVFNFGLLELIAEMPLAINPSGCARSEPKMQTYMKRSRSSQDGSRVTSLPGLRRSSHPSLSNSTVVDSTSKQYQSSRSQQYRRLKSEVNGNVILGRSRIQGIGLFAARDLDPQTMVIEYIGELIRSELANKREKEYEVHNRGIYMFRLDDNTVIDATVCGGLARYINHSCQPNCCTEYLNFGDHSHIVIITTRHISKGEELCYDYNFDLEDRVSKIPCLCRAPNCRKWMN